MDVIIERDQVVEMRDGTILRADVYRPTEPGADFTPSPAARLH